MQNRPRIWALVTATALAAGVAIFFAPQFMQSIAARDAQPANAVRASAPASAVETTRIVPADVLGTGVISWAPLTGDGSN
jgi:hypothetical protein